MKKRRIALAALLVSLALLLTACGGSIEGTWKLVEIKGTGIDSALISAVQMLESIGIEAKLTFQRGVLTLPLSVLGATQTYEKAYQLKGDKLIIEGEELTWQVHGDSLTLTKGDQSILPTRV